jgi:hypothetical protein
MVHGSGTSATPVLYRIRSVPHRQQQRRAAGRQAQHQRLDRQLADDAAARGADRQTDRDLALPRRGARENQVRDIRARDQEHETDDGHDARDQPA